MKRLRTLDALLEELRKLAIAPKTSPTRYELFSAVDALQEFHQDMVDDPTRLPKVLEVGRLLRTSVASGRARAEERFLTSLETLAGSCVQCMAEAGSPMYEAFPSTQEVPGDLVGPMEILRGLHEFALECFQFQRSRDSFEGKRRDLALEILKQVAWVVDLPEILQMAREALAKPELVDAAFAASFIKYYFVARDEPPSREICKELLALARKSDSHSTVYSALNALVETGVIGELDAMDRMDTWRHKHGE